MTLQCMKRWVQYWLLGAIVIMAHRSLSYPSQGYAQMVPRLAVLTLQGEVGSSEERMSWSDTVRAAALHALGRYEIKVIDRDQFLMLLPPDQKLEECVGLCSAQLARVVGARWALSGDLLKRAQSIGVTLRLHSANGDLLGVEQGECSTVGQLPQTLKTLTGTLIRAALLKEPTPAEAPSSAKEIATQEEIHPEPHQEKDAISSVLNDPSPRWISLVSLAEGGCISPLISREQYSACVHAGGCSPSASWGRCQGDQGQPIRCINVQQALQFAAWSGGWLPDQQEWSMWLNILISERAGESPQEAPSQGGHVPYEWVVPSQRPQESTRWRDRYLIASAQVLKVAKPIEARRVALKDQAKFQKRRSPLAFQLPDLSFRVVYPDQRCRVLMK